MVEIFEIEIEEGRRRGEPRGEMRDVSNFPT